MKQVGMMLLLMAVLGLISMSFHLQDTFWETVFAVVLMGAFAFIPQPRQILAWKLHWRLALFAGVICTCVILWQVIDRIMGEYRDYSVLVTLVVLSLMAFLYHYLDRRGTSK